MAGTSIGGKKAAKTLRKRIGKKQLSALRSKAASTGGRGYFGYLKEHDPEKLKAIIAKREAKRKGR